MLDPEAATRKPCLSVFRTRLIVSAFGATLKFLGSSLVAFEFRGVWFETCPTTVHEVNRLEQESGTQHIPPIVRVNGDANCQAVRQADGTFKAGLSPLQAPSCRTQSTWRGLRRIVNIFLAVLSPV